MIKVQDITPKVYYEHSRDFQFLGRLYDIVLNSVKTNTDLIYSLPLSVDADEQLIDLMAMTFGFKLKHDYNVLQLKSLCACFAKVIRNKGNITAIEDACTAVVRAEGIKNDIVVERDAKNFYQLNIFVPIELSDLNLLKDLLNYILPAGMSCAFIRALVNKQKLVTEINYDDTVEYSIRRTADVSQVISATDYDYLINGNKPFDYTGAFANNTVISGTLATQEQESNDKGENK